MKEKRRQQKILVTLEKRQLVLHSDVLHDNPEVKSLLTKYEKIYQSDFEDTKDFTPVMQTFFLYQFKNLLSEAIKEWYSSYEADEIPSNNQEDWVNCALCGRKNKLIFYIVNRLNNEKLNVGSDCILKFPELADVKGISVKKIKRERIKELNKIVRVGTFNASFPGALDMVKRWRDDYNELPIVMSANIHNRASSLYLEAENLYNDYINGKLNDEALNAFKTLATKNDKLIKTINYQVVSNLNKPFICTKEIKDWLIANDKRGIVNKIINNGGYLSSETIGNIYGQNLFTKYAVEFVQKLDTLKIRFDNVREDNFYFELKLPKLPVFCFECSLKQFMASFGQLLFEENSLIDSSQLIKISSLVWNDSNINNSIKYFNSCLKSTPYSIYFDFKTGEIKYQDNEQKLFSTAKANVFCSAQKHLLLLDEKTIESTLVQLLKFKINWKTFDEKEKFAISESDINKNPYQQA